MSINYSDCTFAVVYHNDHEANDEEVETEFGHSVEEVRDRVVAFPPNGQFKSVTLRKGAGERLEHIETLQPSDNAPSTAVLR